MAIEKCVTVSYSLSMQPVLAFVGGLEFDILPAPLADIDTMVCWPDKQPGPGRLSNVRHVSELDKMGLLRMTASSCTVMQLYDVIRIFFLWLSLPIIVAIAT